MHNLYIDMYVDIFDVTTIFKYGQWMGNDGSSALTIRIAFSSTQSLKIIIWSKRTNVPAAKIVSDRVP